MKLEELLTGKDGIGYPLLDHEVVMALMDISERLQRLERVQGGLLELLKGRRNDTCAVGVAVHTHGITCSSYTDSNFCALDVLAEQGKE